MEKDEVFLWSVLSFTVGVAIGSFFVPPLVVLFLCSGALAIAVFSVFPKKEVAFISLIVLLWFLGAHLALEARETFQSLATVPGATQGNVRIMIDPVERDFFRQTVVRFETCESGHCPETNALWQAPLSFVAEAGALIAFSCRLELPKNFTPGFDYRMYLAKDGIGYVCTKAERASVLPRDIPGRLRAFLYVPKHTLERSLSQILSEPEAGLAKGLLLGGDNYLPQAQKEAFTHIGLTHIIAVSGYNITLIAEMLLTAGLFLGLWRKQAVWGALLGIVFFIIMIGLPASALRAGAMAGIVFVAFQTGRLARPENALLFVGGAMLFFNPLLFRYDLGFQLSFLATLGILWVMPYSLYFVPKNVLLRKIVEVLSMTGAVLLFVLPISLFSFGTFSPLIIVGNFLVILVPFAMAASFVAAVLFLLVPGAHLFVAWIAFGLLTLITRGVETLNTIGGARIMVEGFGSMHLIVWYSVLAIGIMVCQRRFVSHTYE